jgi:hypothetical protein
MTTTAFLSEKVNQILCCFKITRLWFFEKEYPEMTEILNRFMNVYLIKKYTTFVYYLGDKVYESTALWDGATVSQLVNFFLSYK